MRSYLKRRLEEDPEEAAYDEYDYGDLRSKLYNGRDSDSTRRREEYEERYHRDDYDEERESF